MHFRKNSYISCKNFLQLKSAQTESRQISESIIGKGQVREKKYQRIAVGTEVKMNENKWNKLNRKEVVTHFLSKTHYMPCLITWKANNRQESRLSCENMVEWSFRHIEPVMPVDTCGQWDTACNLEMRSRLLVKTGLWGSAFPKASPNFLIA